MAKVKKSTGIAIAAVLALAVVAGGLIQISTKEVSNNFFNLSLGGGYGLISTNKKIYR